MQTLQEYRARKAERWLSANALRLRREFWAAKAAEAVPTHNVARLRRVR